MRRGCLAALLIAGCYSPRFPTGAACSVDEPCPDRQPCVNGVCGGVAGDAAPDVAVQNDAAIDAPPTILIKAAGVWSAASELRRIPLQQVSRKIFTLATWYFSDNMGTMPVCAGISASDQTFVWADDDAPVKTPYFQHNGFAVGIDPGVAWPYSGQWVHLVVAVDTSQAAFDDRVKWYVNGVKQPTLLGTSGEQLPQNQDLHWGNAGAAHTIGNKFDGAFNWTGMLAETYVIWGHQLDASAFVTITTEGARSIEYVGPVEAESVYFNYETPGENVFAGQPAWIPTSMSNTTTNLPY